MIDGKSYLIFTHQIAKERQGNERIREIMIWESGLSIGLISRKFLETSENA